MRFAPARALTLVLALLVALPAAANALREPDTALAAAPANRPPDAAALDALDDLRIRNPAAFVAAVTALANGPPPSHRSERERLTLLQAHAEHLQGRTSAAIARAENLATSAEDAGLRFTSRVLVVNLLGGTRDFGRLLRTLGPLLDDAREGRLGQEQQTRLFSTAAILYNELGRPDLATVHARNALALGPTPRLACQSPSALLAARDTGRDPSLTTADFNTAHTPCHEAGDVYGVQFITLTKTRFLARTDSPEAALAVLDGEATAREATGYLWLMAEGAALRASLLLALDRNTEAEAEARRAVDWSAELPSGRPMVMAQDLLYRLALQRGDQAAALRHLQEAMQAEHLGDEERRAQQEALLVVEHEIRQQQQDLALARQQAASLAQAEANASAAQRNTQWLAVLLGVGVLLVLGWGLWVLQEQRRYRRLARTDALTGFANRAGFVEAADRALRRAARRGQPITLVVFDLDLFKQVNDSHGHLAGDAVLRAVADTLRDLPGPERLVGRIGGEEFAMLLPGATPAEARGHAEACRLAIAGTEAQHEGRALRVTASFGVARADLVPAPLAELLARADRALYRAKHAGRDRIVEHDDALVG